MRHITRFLGFIFATGALVFVIGAGAAASFILNFQRDLPDYTTLKDYEPPVMTRVHASDGSLIAEYARERRLYLPGAAIPALVKEAFISAEDKNFYNHVGIDPEGILRNVMVLVEGG
ncbi:MAG: transglycosylase domain-containing protein, partial [Alphaproteobacteria bacterium]|nr:transglycosylase domain-containing protein [Alphaproteobacteria bacterium]